MSGVTQLAAELELRNLLFPAYILILPRVLVYLFTFHHPCRSVSS